MCVVYWISKMPSAVSSLQVLITRWYWNENRQPLLIGGPHSHDYPMTAHGRQRAQDWLSWARSMKSRKTPQAKTKSRHRVKMASKVWSNRSFTLFRHWPPIEWKSLQLIPWIRQKTTSSLRLLANGKLVVDFLYPGESWQRGLSCRRLVEGGPRCFDVGGHWLVGEDLLMEL